MKQIALISGKGGTGKTSLAAAFAALKNGMVMADCDVDAANLDLLLDGTEGNRRVEEFLSGYEAVVDPLLCTGCGQCIEVCRFGAVTMVGEPGPGSEARARIFDISCEGCGCCEDICSTGAVVLKKKTAGELIVSSTRFGTLVHARLTPGEGTSGKLVTMVRNRALEAAEAGNNDLVLIDGSPGIGCPVIASITGTDAVLIVTEPSIAGEHDLERAADLCNHFRIPCYVILNKYDLDRSACELIGRVCDDRGIIILGRIPFDPVFIHAMASGTTVIEYGGGTAAELINETWHAFEQNIGNMG